MKYTLLIFLMFSSYYALTQVSRQYLVPVADSKVYAEVQGRGPAVILLHAGNCDHRMWKAQLAEFARHFRVVLCDLRGCGATQDGDSTYLQSEAILSVMDALHIQTASFVGLSLGSVASLDFAMAHPERVDRLVLASPGLIGIDLNQDSALRRYDRMMEAAKSRHDTMAMAEAFVRTWVDGPARTPQEVNASVRREMKEMVYQNISKRKNGVHLGLTYEPSQLERLPSVKKRILIITGSKDVKDILSISKVFEKHGAKMVYVPDAAHMVNMERPDIFNREVMNFLKAAGSKSR